jgi:hypothetical protein
MVMVESYQGESSSAGGVLSTAWKRFCYILGDIVEIPEPVNPADSNGRKDYPLFDEFEEDTAGDLRDK